jgi:beta-1,4-mannosyltransferase
VPQIRVMQSAPVPKPTTNPYIVMLSDNLSRHPDVELLHFSWKSALTQKIDVFHAHWPEILVSGASPLKKLVRQVLFVVLLLRFRLTRTAVVRTVHNLHLPQGISRREALLLRLFERITNYRIRINPTTVIPDDQPSSTILHGHYREWFPTSGAVDPVPGNVTYFGLIRRYKGTESLIRAFRAVPDRGPELHLTVAGRPSTAELSDELVRLSAGDPSIELHLAFLSDEELIDTVGRAHLVVLPYREMHNSGGALTALSLRRPVLVPDNEVNRALREEVGAAWVHTYAGDLTPQDLISALDDVALPLAGEPDLGARDWGVSTDLHVRAYQEAVRLRRRT